jgi:hypothetical protein
MGKVRVSADFIALDQIEQDENLRERLAALSLDQTVDLEIDGTVGSWQRTRVDVNGRAVDAIRPIGQTADAWSSYARDRVVDVWWVLRPDSLATFGLRLVFWDIPSNQIK